MVKSSTRKVSSPNMASKASKVLSNPKSTQKDKSLAASVLAQARAHKSK